MPGIIVPQRWRHQPQQSLQIDRSHPLGAICILASVPGVDRGVGYASTFSAAISARREGRTANFSSGSSKLIASLPNSRFAVVALGRYVSSALQYILAQDFDGSTEGYTFREHNGGINSAWFGGGSGLDVTATISGVSVGDLWMPWANVGASGVSETHSVGYIAAGSAGSASATGAFTARSTRPTYIGAGANVSTPWRQYTGELAAVLVFSRWLTDAERRSLWDNPWQIFKPVSARTWALMTGSGPVLVSATQDTAWTVRNAASASQAMAWSVRAAVGASIGAAWSVRNAVAGSNSSAWSVRNAVTASSTTAWTVRNAIAATQALAWSVLSAGTVTASQGLGWSVRNTVASSQGAAWSVRATVASAQALGWSVRLGVSATRVVGWSVRNAVQGSQGAAWRVAGYVVGTQAISWTVGDVLPIERFAPRGGMRANAQASTRPAALSTDRPDVIQRARRPLN